MLIPPFRGVNTKNPSNGVEQRLAGLIIGFSLGMSGIVLSLQLTLGKLVGMMRQIQN